MRLRAAGMRPFALPLVRPLGTAHGPIRERRGWLVRLEDQEGCLGVGEATPLAEFGTEGLDACEAALVQGLEMLVASPGAALEARVESVARIQRSTPCAAAGLDSALHDWAARHEGLSLAGWLRRRAGLPGSPASSVRVQALVGGDSPGAVAESARSLRSQGYDTFKLKLCVATTRGCDLESDLERVAALREIVGPTARVRLDANECWSRSEAARALAALEPFDIELVEQPVARDDLDGLASLSKSSPIALAVDEGLLGEGLEACLGREIAPILVAKPGALGGIGPAVGLASRAFERALRVVWSTLIDGAVGRGVVWHLAAALSPPEETHGLATGSWLEKDLATGPSPVAGRLGSPSGSGPGLGEALEAIWEGEGDPWLGPARFFGAAT